MGPSPPPAPVTGLVRLQPSQAISGLPKGLVARGSFRCNKQSLRRGFGGEAYARREIGRVHHADRPGGVAAVVPNFCSAFPLVSPNLGPPPRGDLQ